MNSGSRKARHNQLDRDAYRRLAKAILERDGWRCQHCGRRDQLQIHHMVRRSQSGADSEENLIVLCSGCHRSLHAAPGGASSQVRAPRDWVAFAQFISHKLGC